MISVTGEPGSTGVRVGVSLIDHATGMYAAFSILAALKQGGGHTLDVSLWETALAYVSYHLVGDDGDRRRADAAGDGVPRNRAVPGSSRRRTVG